MQQTYGFTLIKDQTIPELNARAKLFRHDKSGAELLSIENADENKVFGISFRTPPADSTGIAHIMEHSVLCGSRKYPVKEPFVELIKGSLKTFVNALTSTDKTLYPVASQNVKDLYNLIDVYLDAVFYPRITPQIFMQEGWHYELDAPDAPMTFKGVVFNEMKGVYSSPDSLLYRLSQQALFPDTIYGVDSGGDPEEIPNLTYQQFKAFHETYYHPSNALLFFYGDDDPAERLRYLNEWLKEFDQKTISVNIDLQQRFAAPKRIVKPYDAGDGGDMARKAMIEINWLLEEADDVEKTLGWTILNHILVGTSASPLRKALIDSGLGEDTTGGLSDDMRELCFATGLKGIAPEDAERIEEVAFSTLTTLAQAGIEPDMIEAAVNTIEFHLREMNTGDWPRGIVLMFGALSTWQHGRDPIEPLAFDKPLQAIKARLQSGERYFEHLIAEKLLKNPHRVTVLLRPDAEFGKQRNAAEEARLAQAKAAMTPAEIETVVTQTQELKRMQETPDSPEALAMLPMLTLADMDKQNKLIPTDLLKHGSVEILHHDLFTNGIVYLDLAFDLHTLPQELLPYAPLFGRALINLGTETEDFVKLQQRIGCKTGGIWPRFFNSAVIGQATSAARLVLRGKATVAQSGAMLDILRDILLTLKLDNQERFKQLVLENKARKESSLASSGSYFAGMRLGAHFHESGWLSEQTHGVSSLFFTRQLADEVERDWPSVFAKLEAIRRILINRNALLCNVTVDRENWAAVLPQLTRFVETLPAAPVSWATWTPETLAPNEGFTIPTQVNYVIKGANLYAANYRHHGSISVINNYLRTTWLWEKVRVQGGAYGGYCGFDRRSGLFSFSSYRDPNLLSTLDNYDQTARFLREAEISGDELAKSIIGVIGQIDDYMLPDEKGYTAMVWHLLGESDDVRQRIRDEVLSTTVDDFRRFADVLDAANQHGLVVVMGSPEAIDKANQERGGWLETLKVL